MIPSRWTGDLVYTLSCRRENADTRFPTGQTRGRPGASKIPRRLLWQGPMTASQSVRGLPLCSAPCPSKARDCRILKRPAPVRHGSHFAHHCNALNVKSNYSQPNSKMAFVDSKRSCAPTPLSGWRSRGACKRAPDRSDVLVLMINSGLLESFLIFARFKETKTRNSVRRTTTPACACLGAASSSSTGSNCDDTRELLDAVEQGVALFDGLLVEMILVIRPIAADNSLDLVHLATETPACHQFRDLAVQERHC